MMLRNLHYLRQLGDEVIDEIIRHLEVKRYCKGSNILKTGDVSDVSLHLKIFALANLLFATRYC